MIDFPPTILRRSYGSIPSLILLSGPSVYISFDNGHVIYCISKCIGLQPRTRKVSRFILANHLFY